MLLLEYMLGIDKLHRICDNNLMKNITLAVPESVEKFIRKQSAAVGKSLSKHVTELLMQQMKRNTEQDLMLAEFLAQVPYVNTKGVKLKREDAYDRKILR